MEPAPTVESILEAQQAGKSGAEMVAWIEGASAR